MNEEVDGNTRESDTHIIHTRPLVRVIQFRRRTASRCAAVVLLVGVWLFCCEGMLPGEWGSQSMESFQGEALMRR